jgi:large subunit ribosomal protein L19
MRNMGILQYLQIESRKSVDPNGERWALLDAKSPTRAGTGSLLRLTYRISRSSPAPVVFNGVLLAIRRSPGNPTIIVRGIIDNVGVEQVFSVFSPLLEKIEILKAALRTNSKKQYALRESPSKILKLQNASVAQETGKKKLIAKTRRKL